MTDLRVARGLDWGSASPGCVLWGAALPDSHAHIFDELKFQRMTVEQVAGAIAAKDAEWGLTTLDVPCYCDPALKMATGQIGEDYLMTFARYGVRLTPVSNHREAGWQRVHEALGASPTAGSPWLTVDPRCKYLVRTIPLQVQDDHNPEDLDTTGDDHPVDALRYLLMGGLRAGSKAAVVAPVHREGSFGWFKKWYGPQTPVPMGSLSR